MRSGPARRRGVEALGPANAVVLETALQLARKAAARVVLYDRSAESLANRRQSDCT